MDTFKIFSGSSHPKLAGDICRILGEPLCATETYNYRNGCFEVALVDNMRGYHVFILQTSVPDKAALHIHLFELLEMVQAARKASADKITVFMPHTSYARSDRKWRGHIPITGHLLANLLCTSGMDRFVAMDLHSSQFLGFFPPNIVVDHLSAFRILADHLKEKQYSPEEALILPGDRGFQAEAERFGEALGLPVGRIEKKRLGDEKVVIKSIEGPIEGRHIILCDDEIAAATTVRTIAEELEERGALGITAVATHMLCSPKTVENLRFHLFEEVVVTDSVPLPPIHSASLPLKILSVAPLLAQAVKEICTIGGSISKLFE